MKRALPAAVAIVLLCLQPAAMRPAEPESGTYSIRPEDSRIGFTITKWLVFKEEGRFREFRGAVEIDRADPAASRVSIEIDAASLDTRNRSRDQTVRSEDFLDTRRYPTLRFESRRVRPKGPSLFEVAGDLTIRGKTRPVTIEVRAHGPRRVDGVGDLAGFETSFPIRRSDFGVLGARWSGGKAILSDEVVVHIELGALRTAPLSRASASRPAR